LLHTLKNQTLELFCLTCNSFLLEFHGRVFFTQTACMPSAGQSCAHGKLCLNLELRTWLPLPSPASESDALMSFFSSPSCSHVIFVWVYIIIIISVPSPDSSSAGGILAKTGWFCERKHYLAGLMNSEMSGNQPAGLNFSDQRTSPLFFSHNKPAPAEFISPKTNQRTYA